MRVVEVERHIKLYGAREMMESLWMTHTVQVQVNQAQVLIVILRHVYHDQLVMMESKIKEKPKSIAEDQIVMHVLQNLRFVYQMDHVLQKLQPVSRLLLE